MASDAWCLEHKRWARSLGGLLAPQARRRHELRIGLLWVMAMYGLALFFRAYFESLGLRPDNVVFSPPTSDKLYRGGAICGAIDPCFSSKLALSHVHHLLQKVHPRRPLDAIFFPMVESLPGFLHDTVFLAIHRQDLQFGAPGPSLCVSGWHLVQPRRG